MFSCSSGTDVLPQREESSGKPCAVEKPQNIGTHLGLKPGTYGSTAQSNNKVESVRSATENAAPPSFSPCPKPCCFDTFQPWTQEQVLILIKRAPDKTSDLDPVPTWLVQEFAPILAPFFAHVFNVSLERGCLHAS